MSNKNLSVPIELQSNFEFLAAKRLEYSQALEMTQNQSMAFHAAILTLALEAVKKTHYDLDYRELAFLRDDSETFTDDRPLAFLQDGEKRNRHQYTPYYSFQNTNPSISKAVYNFLHNLPSFLSQNPSIQSKLVELVDQIRTINLINQLSWFDEEPRLVDFYSITPYKYHWGQGMSYWDQDTAYWNQGVSYWDQGTAYWDQGVSYWDQGTAYWNQNFVRALAYLQSAIYSSINLFPIPTKTLQFLLKKLLDVLNRKLLSKLCNTHFIRLIGKGIEGCITYTTWARPPTIQEHINAFLSFLIKGCPGHSYSLVTNNG